NSVQMPLKYLTNSVSDHHPIEIPEPQLNSKFVSLSYPMPADLISKMRHWLQIPSDKVTKGFIPRLRYRHVHGWPIHSRITLTKFSQHNKPIFTNNLLLGYFGNKLAITNHIFKEVINALLYPECE